MRPPDSPAGPGVDSRADMASGVSGIRLRGPQLLPRVTPPWPRGTCMACSSSWPFLPSLSLCAAAALSLYASRPLTKPPHLSTRECDPPNSSPLPPLPATHHHRTPTTESRQPLTDCRSATKVQVKYLTCLPACVYIHIYFCVCVWIVLYLRF